MKAEPDQIESPCIRNCCLDENDICLGCFRSISEITSWGIVDDQKRKEILQEAESRRETRLKIRTQKYKKSTVRKTF